MFRKQKGHVSVREEFVSTYETTSGTVGGLARRWLFALAAACLWLGIASNGCAAKGKELRIEDDLKTRYLAEYTPITFSPDGQYLAYTVRSSERKGIVEPGSFFRTGAEWYSQGTDVFLVDLRTGASRRLTAGGGNHWLPVWSPDGNFLAFLSDVDGGQAKLWIWERQQDRLRKVSDTILRSEQIAWTADSRRIIVTALPRNLTPEEYARRISPQSEVLHESSVTKESATVTTYRSLAHRENQPSENQPDSDPWNLDRFLRSLVVIDMANGAELRLIESERVAKFFLSPDGSRIAFTLARAFEHAGSQQILFDLAVINLNDGKENVVAANIRLDYDGAGFSWSPDGEQLSFLTGGPGARVSDCYVVEATGSMPRNLTKQESGVPSHGHPGRPAWDSRGNLYFLLRGGFWRASAKDAKAVEVARFEDSEVRQFFTRTPNVLWDDAGVAVVIAHNSRSKEEGLFRVNLETGQSKRLLGGAECFACGSPYQVTGISSYAGKLVFLREDARHPPDLWMTEPRTETAKRLTDLNNQLNPVELGSTRLVEWYGIDGETLNGALLLPSDYEEGKRYPLVVFVYAGGLLSEHLNHFGLTVRGPLNMQLLATRGYAVLFPDSPQHVGTPMADVLKTVLPGVSKVIEMGVADRDRLGVIGFSNGGYSTFALIVQTKRFKAAVEINGPADLVGAYGELNKSGAAYATALFEQGLDALGGTPWEVRERYIENSPIHYLDRVSTPLLILQGEEDVYVSPFLADQAFVGLRRLGKEVEYAKYSGEGHDPMSWSYAHQMDFCRRFIAWFDMYLKSADKNHSEQSEPGTP